MEENNNQPNQQNNYQQNNYQQNNYQPNHQNQMNYNQQPIQQAKPKVPLQLGNVFQALFSRQPYQIFNINLDILSLALLLVLGTAFASLTMYDPLYVLFSTFIDRPMGAFGAFILSAFISILCYAAILGVMLAFGVIATNKFGNTKARIKAIVDTIAVTSLVPMMFYLLGFIFHFFWQNGWLLISFLGYFIHVMTFFDGIMIRFGVEAYKLWYRILFASVGFAIFFFPIVEPIFNVFGKIMNYFG